MAEGVYLESRRRLWVAPITLGGGGVMRVVESLRPLLPLSPDPLLDAPWEWVVESLLPLRLDSPEPRREPPVVGVMTVVVV